MFTGYNVAVINENSAEIFLIFGLIIVLYWYAAYNIINWTNNKNGIEKIKELNKTLIEASEDIKKINELDKELTDSIVQIIKDTNEKFEKIIKSSNEIMEA